MRNRTWQDKALHELAIELGEHTHVPNLGSVPKILLGEEQSAFELHLAQVKRVGNFSIVILTALQPSDRRPVGRVEECTHALLIRDVQEHEKDNFRRKGNLSVATSIRECFSVLSPELAIPDPDGILREIILREAGIVQPYINTSITR